MEKKIVKDNDKKLTPEERENSGNWKELKKKKKPWQLYCPHSVRFKEAIAFIKGEQGGMKMKNMKNKEYLEIRHDC